MVSSPEELLLVANHLERLGNLAAALKLCQDAARVDSLASEPYLIGLRLARDLNDVDAMAWACAGVLSQAWPKGQEKLEEEVRLLARATHLQLLEDGKQEKADAFVASINQATARDCIVEVRWTGDADIDVMVEEPAGTVCSLEHPRSAGGGVLLGDGYSTGRSSDDGQIVETYICPQGFTGQYRMLVRRIWGDVSTGHVTVSILTDVGRPSQRYIQQQIPLTEKDALITFEVKDGRRQDELAVAQLDQLREVQSEMNGVILAQVGAAPADGNPLKPGVGGIAPSGSYNPDYMRDFYRNSLLARYARNNGFGRGAVGFMPVITTIPEGAFMQARGVISGDRRYVRITPSPSFMAIGDVSTFNYVTGATGAGGAGGAGGGGFGGAGGGVGGAGGGGIF